MQPDSKEDQLQVLYERREEILYDLSQANKARDHASGYRLVDDLHEIENEIFLLED